MLSFALFLQGGKPNSGGIQIREVYYYAQEASQFFKASELYYSAYHSILAISAVVVMLRCNEISRKSRVYSINDFISLLAGETSYTSLSAAVHLGWIGILQSIQNQRKSVFTLVLAAIRFKKVELYEYAIWCCLHAWKLCYDHNLHYIHVSTFSTFSCVELPNIRDSFITMLITTHSNRSNSIYPKSDILCQ